ncbi:MAG: Flp pilus assembly protein CpaB [Alphaproteobacteria bacterium]|nr:Flp pilus assembly protein CpaB [Alphaproteobacteria bacterium]MBF0250032.1 Flp pilus assembly protein CpaB [Alphaproteobacteria bacterium]
MRGVVIGLIFAAIILAGGTAYLLRSYITTQQEETAARAPKTPTSQVLVAGADLPAGTVINDKNVAWQPWPDDAIQETFMARDKKDNPLPALIKDKHVVRRAIVKGEPITLAKLYKSDKPGFMPGSLAPGMRAVSVKTAADTASSGFIMPGDRIDLVLTHTMFKRAATEAGAPTGELIAMQHVSETILHDLNVLAIDQKVSEFEKGAALSKTVLLEVTPKQAEIITTAKAMGKLSLVLRSAEPGDTKDGISFVTDVEVSPLLSHFKAFASGMDPRKDGAEGMDQDQDQEQEQAASAFIPAPEDIQMPGAGTAPAAPPPGGGAKVTIYRGVTEGVEE